MSAANQKDEVGLTRRVESCGFTFYLTVNLNDGHPSCILIKSEKVGSNIRGFLYVTTLLISMLLKDGKDWDEISKELMYHRFEPCTEDVPSLVHDLVVNVTELLDESR